MKYSDFGSATAVGECLFCLDSGYADAVEVDAQPCAQPDPPDTCVLFPHAGGGVPVSLAVRAATLQR